jgi:hypothetical protein
MIELRNTQIGILPFNMAKKIGVLKSPLCAPLTLFLNILSFFPSAQSQDPFLLDIPSSFIFPH